MSMCFHPQRLSQKVFPEIDLTFLELLGAKLREPCCSWVCFHLGNLPSLVAQTCALYMLLLLSLWKHGTYLVNTVIFIYKLTLCYLQVTIL